MDYIGLICHILGAFWVQPFMGVIYYWQRLTAITGWGDRIPTYDLVLLKHLFNNKITTNTGYD